MLNDVRKKLSVITGANIEIGQPISHRIDAMLSGTQASIAIKLFGDDLNKMFEIGNQIKDAIGTVDGIADLNVEQQIERPELEIKPKRDMLKLYGISIADFNTFVPSSTWQARQYHRYTTTAAALILWYVLPNTTVATWNAYAT